MLLKTVTIALRNEYCVVESQHFLSVYYIPATVVVTRAITMNKQTKIPALMKLTCWQQRHTINKINMKNKYHI